MGKGRGGGLSGYYLKGSVELSQVSPSHTINMFLLRAASSGVCQQDATRKAWDTDVHSDIICKSKNINNSWQKWLINYGMSI